MIFKVISIRGFTQRYSDIVQFVAIALIGVAEPAQRHVIVLEEGHLNETIGIDYDNF